jgi:hypothetical protein
MLLKNGLRSDQVEYGFVSLDKDPEARDIRD